MQIEFEIDSGDLGRAIGVISGAALEAGGDKAMPAQRTVKMIGADGEVRMYGWTMAAATVYPMRGKFKQSFECCVEYKQLVNMAKHLSGPVEFRVKDGWAFIKSGPTRFRVPSTVPEVFPPFERGEVPMIAVGNKQLSRALKACLIAVGKEASGVYMVNNLHLSYKAGCGGLQVEACSGPQGARVMVDVRAEIDNHIDLILSPKAAPAIIRMCDTADGDEDVFLGVDGNHAQLVFQGEVAMRFSTPTGKFPDMDRLIPKARDHEIDMDRGHLTEILTKADMFSTERAVETVWAPGSMSVRSSAKELGVFNESMELNGSSQTIPETITVIVIAQQILGCLRQLRGERVTLGFNSEPSQVTLKSASADDGILLEYVTMPFRPKTAVEDLDNVWAKEEN